MKNILNNASALRSAFRGIAVIAIAAVIGLSVTACKEDEGDTFNGQTLKSGVPSNSTLKAYGISSNTINALINAARAADDPDYKGYYEYTINYTGMMKMKMLMFVWYNKTEDKHGIMCKKLETELELDYWQDGLEDYMSMGQSSIPKDTIKASSGTYDIGDNIDDMFSCSVQFYLKNYQDVPKDTLAVGFSITSYSFNF